ncbi:MAG: enhancer of polycomb-like protein 1, partial [Acinetobacter sp.]|nr:enhancer of polycomb-like protein 1 [Acinetobacter sp.]
REPSKNSDRCGRDTYIRQFEIPTSIVKQSDQIDHESTIKQYLNKRQLLVEYDMDEQDTLYLQDRNKQTKNVIKITPEVFETMISTLEDEAPKDPILKVPE